MSRARRLVALAALVLVLAGSLSACEEEVRGQALYLGDQTAADASSWVAEQVTAGATGLLVSVNAVADAGVGANEYWEERLGELAEATGGFDVVVLSLGVTDLEAGDLPSDLDERVDAIATAATTVATRAVYWSTVDETVAGHEEAAATVNEALAQAAASHPTLHLLDFGAELAAHPEYRVDDGLRWTTEGQRAFAALVDAELTELLDPPVPAVAIVKTVDEAEVVAGEDLHLHLRVTNTGEVALHHVTVSDEAAPGCAGPLPDLAPGGSSTVDCTRPTSNEDVPTYVNVATVDTDETDPVASEPVTVRIAGTHLVRVKVRLRGDAPAKPQASVRLRCTGATPTFEQVFPVSDQLVRAFEVPADRPACVVRQLSVKGDPQVSYEATSTTAKTTVSTTSARIAFATPGGEQAKVVITDTYPGTCPVGQASC